jgi:hypothetical protein
MPRPPRFLDFRDLPNQLPARSASTESAIVAFWFGSSLDAAPTGPDRSPDCTIRLCPPHSPKQNRKKYLDPQPSDDSENSSRNRSREYFHLSTSELAAGAAPTQGQRRHSIFFAFPLTLSTLGMPLMMLVVRTEVLLVEIVAGGELGIFG